MAKTEFITNDKLFSLNLFFYQLNILVYKTISIY